MLSTGAAPKVEQIMAKYIALSDIHLGQSHKDKIEGGQYCLLSEISTEFPQASRRSQIVLSALSQRVAEFANSEDVTLVVVGDLLDLSLASVNESLVDLVALLRRLPNVKELVYVIGNHDHHIWSLHSEWERSLLPLQRGEFPEKAGVYQTTDRHGERHHLLSELCTRQLERPMQITVAYPTFSFEDVASETEKSSLFYFTHGHLFGGLYTTLSDVFKARIADQPQEEVAATVNAPLIEFIYWSLSQAGGGLGADGLMEQVYADLQRGDSSKMKELIESAVGVLLPEGVIPVLPNWLEQRIAASAAVHMIKKSVSLDAGSMSRDRHSGVATTRQRLEKWAALAKLDTQRKTHIVYGHTHVADTFVLPNSRLHSYNLGSWLVEPGRETPDMQLFFVDTKAPEHARVRFESLACGAGFSGA